MDSNEKNYYRLAMESSRTGWWHADAKASTFYFSENMALLFGTGKDRKMSYEEYVSLVDDNFRECVCNDIYGIGPVTNAYNTREYAINTVTGRQWIRVKLLDVYPDGCQFGTIRMISEPTAGRDLSKENKSPKILKEIDKVTKAMFNFVLDNNENEMMSVVLQSLLEYYDANYAYMVEFKDENKIHSVEFQTFSSGKKDQGEENNVVKSSDIPWWTDTILKRRPIIFNDINKMPPEAKAEHERFKKINIKSILVVPFFIKNKVTGYLGVYSVDKHQNWVSDDYLVINSVSNMISLFTEMRIQEHEGKRIMELSNNNDKFWGELFENIPINEVVFNLDGTIKRVNNRAMDFFELKQEKDMIGFNVFDDCNFTPEDVKNIKENDSYVLDMKYDFDGLSKQLPIRRKGKTHYYLRFKKLYRDGQPEAYIALGLEDNDKLISQDKKRDFESLIDIISNYAKLGFCRVNILSGEGYANNQWYINMKEPIGRPLKEIIGIDNKLEPEDQKAIADIIQKYKAGTADKFMQEMRVRRPGTYDEWDWIYVHSIVTKYAPEEGIVEYISVNYDITTFKENEKMLIEARKRAEMLDNMKSAFLANMSHEIRTPLNAIVGFSELIANNNVGEDPESAKFMSIIHENTDLLLTLINDILDLSKLEAGIMEFKFNKVNLNMMLGNIAKSSSIRMRTNVEMVFEENEKDVVISTDQSKVTQVVNNLITNAIKFTKKGSITLGLEHQDEHHIRIYVRDTGVGISPENKLRVFDRFVKLDTFVQGTGLGLSICQNIVSHLGGTISVDSEVGKGSTFWFVIPDHQIINND